jgi:DNA-binding response OmpR family regulator
MKKATILIIEGRHAEIPSFAADLQKKGFDILSVPNGAQAVSKIKQRNISLVVINAASLRSTGIRICSSIRKKDPKLPLILILEKDKNVSKDIAESVLSLPFTVQKLVNRIKALMPSDGKNIVTAGPIQLDLDHKRVKSLSKSTKLTPRLITLLQIYGTKMSKPWATHLVLVSILTLGQVCTT